MSKPHEWLWPCAKQCLKQKGKSKSTTVLKQVGVKWNRKLVTIETYWTEQWSTGGYDGMWSYKVWQQKRSENKCYTFPIHLHFLKLHGIVAALWWSHYSGHWERLCEEMQMYTSEEEGKESLRGSWKKRNFTLLLCIVEFFSLQLQCISMGLWWCFWLCLQVSAAFNITLTVHLFFFYQNVVEGSREVRVQV